MPSAPKPSIWSPLPRAALDTLLQERAYSNTHLLVLVWLIWLPLLSAEEILRVLASGPKPLTHISSLSQVLKTMRERGLIDRVTLREPGLGRELRYYATDLGLYLYLSVVETSPPLTAARLAASYPITRDDLLERLARPSVHLACMSLVSRLVAEGATHGYGLDSYQQPWQHDFQFASKKERLASDAALLLLEAAGTSYAFLIHVDMGRGERAVEKWLLAMLDLRQQMRLYRQSWPALLIICPRTRLALWSQLLQETSLSRTTAPLAGGITLRETLHSAPIWWELQAVAWGKPEPVSFWDLLHESVSDDLVEHISRRQHFLQMRLKDAAAPPARIRKHLTRYVGDSLDEEAARLRRARLETLFASHRRSRESIEGTGLLTLALTAAEKELLAWVGKHPLLDIYTLQAILRPKADAEAIKPLQERITHLFALGLIETRLWTWGKTPLERERYLLTTPALKFLAQRAAEPYTFFLIPKALQRGDDEQLDRQWGTRSLIGQMGHTNALYTFMQRLYRMAERRGEKIYDWKSAHDAARWYRDTISQEAEHTRPDAELLFALSRQDEHITMVLVEYDRGTTGPYEYRRKFSAYLDYKQAAGKELPLLVVTVSPKALTLIRQILAELAGELHAVLVLERDLLAGGFQLVPSLLPHDKNV